MTLADDLLVVARHLAHEVDDAEYADGVPAPLPELPEGAASRRSASTAYYAVFHRLVDAALATLMPGADASARKLAQRSIPHTKLKRICSDLANPQRTKPPDEWRDALAQDVTFTVSAELRELATLVVDLQKQREVADYVPTDPFGVINGWKSVRAAERVFELIAAGMPPPEWNMFLASLIFAGHR